ncbi:MAG: hypothetical protein H0V30_11745 [Chitinophagaceae bacterium]|jgi:hypothetical protein|nr:hypothetical protein [Chitinophagaceae bacterium]
MKNLLSIYRDYFQVNNQVPDRTILYHLLVFVLFLFVLGFTVSQVIIYLAG